MKVVVTYGPTNLVNSSAGDIMVKKVILSVDVELVDRDMMLAYMIGFAGRLLPR